MNNQLQQVFQYSVGQWDLPDPIITDVLTSFWNDAFYRPKYDSNGFNYGSVGQFRVVPQSASQVTQYELGFTYNSSNVLVPLVTKLTSQLYDNSLNLTQASQPNGWIKGIPADSGSLLYLNENAVSRIDPTTKGFAYDYINANAYPNPNNYNVTIANTVNLTGSNLPANIDMVIQVKNGNNVTGSNAYNTYINITAGDTTTVKVLKVYGKDQLVVKDYMDNLSFRVGPNGHVYGGDLSTYSVSVNQSVVNGIDVNNNYGVPFNSCVNLA